MSYASKFASRQVVMGGIALRILRVLQRIDEMPTQEERERTAKLYFRLLDVEDYGFGPMWGGLIGATVAAFTAAGIALNAGHEGLGTWTLLITLIGGFALGWALTKVVYYGPRLRTARKDVEEMFLNDPDTMKSLRALDVFDHSIAKIGWKLLPSVAWGP